MTEVSTLTWELEQLNKLSREQPTLVNRAVQRMLGEDQDLRWNSATALLGSVSLCA